MILPMCMHTDFFSLEISPVDMSANCFSFSPQLYDQVSGADFQPRFGLETVHLHLRSYLLGGGEGRFDCDRAINISFS